MTSEQFAYWLQGYAELNEAPPTAEQWRSIREHLALVFQKVTQPVETKVGEPPYVSPTVLRPSVMQPWTTTCKAEAVPGTRSYTVC